MRKIYLLSFNFLLLFLFFNNSLAANWYVDSAAGGSNNGTSWNNAWRSFGNINWNSISAGDSIFISGGTTTKTYNETLTVGKAGSPGNNIVIQTGKESGHNGTVIIDGQKSRQHCILLNDYVTISGKVGNNRKMLVKGSTASGLHSGNADGIVITYLEITECGAAGAPGGFAHGIRLGGADNGCEVSYCYIHHNYQDAYNAGGSAGGAFGKTKIHHNIIVHNSDDGIACRSGHDIYNNIIGDLYAHPGGGDGHPDGIQAQGEYTRIWNNKIYNCSTHGIFVDPLNTGTANHLYVYNNLVYKTNTAPSSMHMQGIKVKAESGTNHIDDVLVANNTVVDMGYLGIEIKADSASNVLVANNIMHNCRRDGTYGYVIGSLSTNSVIDYNVVSTGPDGGNKMMWNGENLSYSDFVVRGYGQGNGQTSSPAFVRYNPLAENNDFHLRSSDTSAKGKGMNLSDYFTTDIDGKQRTSWDIGCFASDGETAVVPASPPQNVRIIN